MKCDKPAMLKRVGFYRLQLSEEEMLGPWLAFQTESSS